MEKNTFEMTKNILVAIIFRPPNTDSGVYIDVLNNFLKNVEIEDKLCYIIGYYNMNILNYDIHAQTTKFVDLLYINVFFPADK